MDTTIADVRLLFISAAAVFQVNINNIKAKLFACEISVPSAELVFYNCVLYGFRFIYFTQRKVNYFNERKITLSQFC